MSVYSERPPPGNLNKRPGLDFVAHAQTVQALSYPVLVASVLELGVQVSLLVVSGEYRNLIPT